MIVIFAAVCLGCFAGALLCLHEEYERGRQIDSEFRREGLVWRRRGRGR